MVRARCWLWYFDFFFETFFFHQIIITRKPVCARHAVRMPVHSQVVFPFVGVRVCVCVCVNYHIIRFSCLTVNRNTKKKKKQTNKYRLSTWHRVRENLSRVCEKCLGWVVVFEESYIGNYRKTMFNVTFYLLKFTPKPVRNQFNVVTRSSVLPVFPHLSGAPLLSSELRLNGHSDQRGRF